MYVLECVACTLYVMYVGMGNLQESVIQYELPLGKLSVRENMLM